MSRDDNTGLECSHCGSHLLAVKDSRPSVNSVRRRRKCLSCGQRLTTFEIISPTSDDGAKLISALALFDKFKSVPVVARKALLAMLNAMATRPETPAPMLPVQDVPRALGIVDTMPDLNDVPKV